MPLIAPSDRTVPITVQQRCRVTPSAAFDAIAPVDLPRIFARRRPMPGVVRTTGQTGEWNEAGRSRTVELSDGSRVAEHLTEHTPPHSFAYELKQFTGSMRHLVSGVRGEWTFTPDGDHTVVRWTYELVPRRGRAAIVRMILGPLWSRYARATLARACAIATSGDY